MEKTVRKRGLSRILAVIAAVLVITMQITPFAYADDVYYATWSEYKESGQPSATWNNVADAMDAVFDHGVELFEAGDYDGAYSCVNDGYYGYYETTGFERIAMGYIAGSRKTEVELQFSACKSVCKSKGSLEDFQKEIDTLKSMIHTDANVLDGDTDDSSSDGTTSDSSGSSTAANTAAFAACFSIMLREGFEAILIVGAIIAYLLKTSGADEKKKKKMLVPVYLGCILGIVMSFVLAWLLSALKLANSASQEVIEGVTALIAVCVLYYVSNWMLSKSETEAWSKYIKGKVQKSTETGSVAALAMTAFLAVFREGAEVVLFFQPMLAEYDRSVVWAGFIVGCIALVFVYLAIHILSINIPLRPFFTATSVLMFVMSISFLGAGIKELIEGDVITASVPPAWLTAIIPSNDVMDVLGLYPRLETLIPQLILLVITIVIFVVQTKKNRAIRAEAEAKRAEELAAKEAEEKKAQEEALRTLVREIVTEVLEERKA